MCVISGSHGFAECLKDLPPEHMKVAGRGGAVHHNPVTVIQLLHLKASCDFLKWTLTAWAKTYKIGCLLHHSKSILCETYRENIRVIVAHLKEALRASRGVFRTLRKSGVCYDQPEIKIKTEYTRITGTYHSLHAMGKQKDNAILAHPLSLACTDELVDDALGCVVEVSKLCLPKH